MLPKEVFQGGAISYRREIERIEPRPDPVEEFPYLSRADAESTELLIIDFSSQDLAPLLAMSFIICMDTRKHFLELYLTRPVDCKRNRRGKKEAEHALARFSTVIRLPHT